MPTDISSFLLILWNEHSFRHEIVACGAERTSVLKFLDAVEAVGWHFVGGDEHGLRLVFRPLIESFVIEGVSPTLVIGVRPDIRNVTIDYAVFWYLHLGIVKRTACNRQVLPPPDRWVGGIAVPCIAICVIPLARS